MVHNHFVCSTGSWVTAIVKTVFAGDKRVAATIRDMLESNLKATEVRIYTATFFSPVAGIIYFREVPDSVAGVQVYGKLYHTTGSDTTQGHNWHVHEFAVCSCPSSF